MKRRPFPRLLPALLWFAASTLHAQVVEFRATINADQENPATTSPAVGTAVMLYDVAENTFDLWVTLDEMANDISASHVHEAAAGANGPVVTNLGGADVYTRDGTTVTGVFRGVTHGGDPVKLLQSGAYLNFHSSAFPAGEVRGQLIAQPKRLTALIDVAQEQAAFPNNTYSSDAYGAAVMLYDVANNRLDLRISLYQFANTLTNSHFHGGPPGVSGPVVTGLGGGTATNYVRVGNWITGTFDDLAYAGDPIQLLTGGTYLNFHSNVYPGGEVRGQVLPSDEIAASRLGNLSARGAVGTGAAALIGGLHVTGPEPVRVLVTAKGPSLAGFGLTDVLANPYLRIYDRGARVIAENDDFGPVIAGSEASQFPNPPGAMDAGMVLVLPPGVYTAAVTGVADGTGVALLEAYDVRDFAGSAGATAQQFIARRSNNAEAQPVAALPGPSPVELCGAPAVALVGR